MLFYTPHWRTATKMSNCHTVTINYINTFLFQRQPIHGHYHWQDEHMPAWLHHPVEKSHHLTWKYHQSSKYNERVFLIFISWYILCNPCQVLTACTSLYSIVSIGISFLDLHAEWQGPNLSVHFRARCSPYLLRKSWLLKSSYKQRFSVSLQRVQVYVSATFNRSAIKTPGPSPVQPLRKSYLFNGWRG